jgi:hypothetical protein
MRTLRKRDWLMFFCAAPLGAIAGALVGYLACLLFFVVTGTGTSHSDAFSMFGMILLGGFAGIFVGPALVWRRWRSESPF